MGVAVHVTCEEGPPDVLGTHVLLAVGRIPNTNDLGLDRAGVATDDRGYIVVDDQLQSNVPGIWAVGDCNGRGAFTNTSFNDYEIVADNLFNSDHRRVSDRIQAYALYIDPPLGRCGMTDAEILKSGRRALVTKYPMSRVSRAYETGAMRVGERRFSSNTFVVTTEAFDCSSHSEGQPLEVRKALIGWKRIHVRRHQS
jgi:pyruvate/2-oxoglutarate dehydrogenase complex dihydrolipoamide dehydrogenase (E3) component